MRRVVAASRVRYAQRTLVLSACCLLCLSVAHAQTSGVPLDRPGERRLLLPDPEPGPAPEIDLPPTELAPSEALKPSRLRVRVTAFRFVGNTVFSDVELTEVVATYLGRDIDSEDLEAIRVALTRHYINRGFINSGAIIPDQNIVNGEITLQLVEGHLSHVEVVGNARLSRSYIEDRILLGAGPPLNVYAVRDRLFVLQQDPRIRRIDAALNPGLRPGEATLRVDVEEEPSRRLYLNANNHRSPSVGATNAELEFSDVNLLGIGDTLGVRYGHTRGLDDIDVSYAVPLTARDTSVTLRYARSHADVIEAPFDALGVESKSDSVGVGIVHPYRKTPGAEHAVGILLERRRSQTFLLDEPFAFEPGADADGKSRVTVLRLQQSWLTHQPARVVAARSTFSIGVDAFDPTINGVEPDARFGAWLVQFQWVERFLERREEFVARADVQLANDALLSLEQFPVGGAFSVRGYRETQLVRDNGMVASLEYRWPLRWERSGPHRLQFAVFGDIGRAWNSDRPTPSPETLSSAGIGLRGIYSKSLEYQLYVGVALRDLDTPSNDLQDHGVHFQVRGRLW